VKIAENQQLTTSEKKRRILGFALPFCWLLIALTLSYPMGNVVPFQRFLIPILSFLVLLISWHSMGELSKLTRIIFTLLMVVVHLPGMLGLVIFSR